MNFRARRSTVLAKSLSAFTLVEIMVSLVIISIIGGMVSIMLSGAQRQAQDTRARAMIDRLNLVVLQLYEEEAYRSVSTIVGTTQSLPAYRFYNEQALRSRSLAQLNWRRDYLRCSLPDRVQDLVDPPINVYYTYIQGQQPSSAVPMLATLDPTDRNSYPPPIPTFMPAASVRYQMQERYRQRILRVIQSVAPTAPTTFAQCVDGNPANGEWTEQYQGAECLYLIMSTHTINGVPAVESLHTRDVGDLDGDGVPEVLDPWGVPVGFLRWPCGYYLVQQWERPPLNATEIAARKVELGKDTIDILYSDPRYDDTTSANFQADDPFAMLPIVVSAGSDGIFDMVGLDTPPFPAIQYAGGTFPVAPFNTLTFPGTPRFIDPYQYGVPPIDQLGARRDTTDLRTDNSADNVFPSFEL